MQYLWLVVFLLLPVAALAYCGWHIWQLLPLGAWWRSAVIAAGVVSFALLFAAVGPAVDRMPMALATWVYNIGCSSLIVLLYLFMLFLLTDLLTLTHILPRTFIHHSWTGTLTLLAVMLAVFTYGYLNYIHKVRVPLTYHSDGRLPHSYRLVMVSDLHLGYHNRRAELARWIDLINAEHPAALLIAGDIVDRSVRPLNEEDMAAEWQRLECPVYACLGNHEYYSGEPESEQFYRRAGITLLRDSSVVIDSCITVIGRDDRTNMRRNSVKQLMSGVNRGTFTILLDHQPYHLEEAEQQGVDLQFSGHTHYGQVWPASWITDALYECAFGPHRRGNTHYYVSSGLGIWGGKFRIGTRSEYTVVTID